MIDKQTLRNLVLEVLKKTPRTQVTSIINDVEALVRKHDLFPSKEDCEQSNLDFRYYAQGNLNPQDGLIILDIIWDLIEERVLTPGSDQSNVNFPLVRVTSFGQAVISQSIPSYYDPSAYVDYLKRTMPNLDPVIEQYASESLNCFKRQLIFASAVMLGAAAEKSIILLLEAIMKWVSDPKKKRELEQLLERPRLPTIYEKIREILSPLVDSDIIPYSVHQGCNEHLLSLYEMIRVQRNDAVHPAGGTVDKAKVFLSLQTMPMALQLVYRLIEWFNNNPITPP